MSTTVLNFEGNRAAFLEAMHSGQPFEMDEESWYYWLEVLPPVYMGRTVKLPSGEKVRASFGFAEGEEHITAFWKQGGKFMGCQTNQLNTYDRGSSDAEEMGDRGREDF